MEKLELNELTAVSPIDGRYGNKTVDLRDYFSEFALIRRRVKVEVAYFLALIPVLPQLESLKSGLVLATLDGIVSHFSMLDAMRVKEYEKKTNHDVKAVEYFLRERFGSSDLEAYKLLASCKEFIHFGLTSEDVDAPARISLFRDAHATVYLRRLDKIVIALQELSSRWSNIPMLAHTHGQPASPTRVGKEFGVFLARIQEQQQIMSEHVWTAKFGGATGNFNAHHLAYSEVNWKAFGEKFLADFNLRRENPTTQISHFDNLALHLHDMIRVNTILLDLARDMWLYISMNYFKQKVKEGETGSSAMPHKVNPIDFENAEGNIGIANVLFDHLAKTLPISRLQRDLSGSTLIRNLGVPFGHTIIAMESLAKGLDKLLINESKINADLEANWAVVAEGIQTILRREKYPDPYEALKNLTRTGEKITQIQLQEFIESLDVSEALKIELMSISPFYYTGI